ncbi:MAG: serine hydrolase [Litorimonas sp.]
MSCVCLFLTLLLSGCEPNSTITEADLAETIDTAASSADPTFDVAHLEANLLELVRHYSVPGMSVVVLEDGVAVYESGFGVRDIESAAPITSDTLFRAGSVTKQFTAALIGMAEDAGQLTLNDNPAQYLDRVEISGQKPDQPIRIENLLTHTSGLGNMDGSLVFFPLKDRQDALSRLPHLPVTIGADEAFSYSNMGYTLAGLIAAPDGFDVALQQKILAPLGMSSSTMSFERMSDEGDIAQGYAMVDGAAVPVGYENMRFAGPAGGLNTTASDLGRWIAFLLNDGIHDGQSLLSRDFIHRATSPQWPKPEDMSGPVSGYGYGFFIDEFEGAMRITHGGNTSGFSSLVDFIPDLNIGVAIMTNQQNSDIVYQAANIVYAHILDLDPIDIGQIERQVSDGRGDNEAAAASASDSPEMDLETFTGTYFEPGYGNIRIRQKDGKLLADFPDFTLPAQYVGENRFILNWTADLHQNIPSFEMGFVLDTDDKVTGFTLPLRLGDEFFVRVTDPG